MRDMFTRIHSVTAQIISSVRRVKSEAGIKSARKSEFRIIDADLMACRLAILILAPDVSAADRA
jgi:hypothetical protein